MSFSTLKLQFHQ